MADEQPPRAAQARRGFPRLRKWIPVAAAALALLALSQALWLWQSWPVRQLLQAAPAATGAPR